MTSGVYVSVIEDVINKVRHDFTDGPGQDLLMQLQATWEAKMMQAGVLDRPAVDLNVLVFPPSRLQAPIQPPPPGTGDTLYNNIPSGPCMRPPYPWMATHQYKAGGGFIPQQDGAGEFFKIEVSGVSSSSTSVVEEDVEPPLNEDDDDDDDLDGVEEEEELNTRNLVLVQFDKVKRTKNKWKCTLKDGIMHMNNRDILFNKATGDFDF